MNITLGGCTTLSLYLITGWVWTIFVGLLIMLCGLIFGYRPVENDPVWKKLVADGVIDQDGH